MTFPLLTDNEAYAALQAGKSLIYPTETFYALGCNALDPDAVGRVYVAKQRLYKLPLPVIVGDKEQVSLVADHVSPLARELMERFWPGPLSLILPASPHVPDLLTAGTGRVAVRLSAHLGAAALCRSSGLALSASSANISGFPPVVRADTLDARLSANVAGIFDPPPAPAGGSPSTIIELPRGTKTQRRIRILRPGAVNASALADAGFAVDV
jgi:L-threonylcarbamoyladenylate synthase